MSKEICYEFARFRLDPVARSLSGDGQPISIRPFAFELLLVVVEHHGQSLTKPQIIKRVWGSNDDLEADNKFHVTLRAARQALGEPLKKPRLIVKDANGYRIAATVRDVPVNTQLHSNTGEPTSTKESLSGEPASVFTESYDSETDQTHPHISVSLLPHILASCTIYGALYGSAAVLEVAYEFDRFGSSALKMWPLVFGWIAITAAVGLKADQKLTLQNKKGGLVASIAIFVISAGIVFLGIPFLPSSPVTLAQFQTYAAQAAYLKDVVYFLIMALLFLILPYHSVLMMEGKMRQGQYRSVLETCTTALSSPGRRAIYPGFWVLALASGINCANGAGDDCASAGQP
jgi:DNA-binding winged helix-turn-helix (wHTH) protein